MVRMRFPRLARRARRARLSLRCFSSFFLCLPILPYPTSPTTFSILDSYLCTVWSLEFRCTALCCTVPSYSLQIKSSWLLFVRYTAQMKELCRNETLHLISYIFHLTSNTSSTLITAMICNHMKHITHIHIHHIAYIECIKSINQKSTIKRVHKVPTLPMKPNLLSPIPYHIILAQSPYSHSPSRPLPLPLTTSQRTNNSHLTHPSLRTTGMRNKQGTRNKK